jgi:hypothetical protein
MGLLLGRPEDVVGVGVPEVRHGPAPSSEVEAGAGAGGRDLHAGIKAWRLLCDQMVDDPPLP